MTLIALEEHYAWDPASRDNVVANWLRSNNPVGHERLYDRGALRLEQMDAAGIDFQILSLFDPGVQDEVDASRAVDLARAANDDLAETVRQNPSRFGGFATLATQDPAAAATELRRAVTELPLVGALINGHCQGRYLDDPAYHELFGCAEELGVPIYLHPTTPHPAVMQAWFAPYVADGMHLASWGFAAETGTHVLRLIYSGLFDRCPGLQMVIGASRRDAAVRRLSPRPLLRTRGRRERAAPPATHAVGLSSDQFPRHDERKLLCTCIQVHPGGARRRARDVLGGLSDGRQRDRRAVFGVVSDGRRHAPKNQLRECGPVVRRPDPPKPWALRS